MFVDPLAEKTMEPYIYVSNNPINMIDPTGMEPQDWIFTFTNGWLTGFRDTGKGNKMQIININKPFYPSAPFSNMQNINERNQIVNYVGKKMYDKVQYSYAEMQGKKGGHYDANNNEILVTQNTFRTNNLFDLQNVIEHEIFHAKNGPVNNFMDHVKVYMQQAKTSTFQKTSLENKFGNAKATGQRLLNAYVNGEIGTFEFDDKISEYNSINSQFQLERTSGVKSKDDVLKIKGQNVEIRYNKQLKPHE